MAVGFEVQDALILRTGPNTAILTATPSGLASTQALLRASTREKAKAAYAASAAVTFTANAATAIATGTTTLACVSGTCNTPAASQSSPILSAVTGGPPIVGQGIAASSGGIQAGSRITAVSPTTATMNQNSGGTGTGVTYFVPNLAVPWRYGRIDMQPFFRYSTSGCVVPYTPTDLSQTPNRRGDQKYAYHIDFDFDGQVFEIICDRTTASTIRVWSNDLVSGDFSITATTATGFISVDFGSVVPRRVTVETDGNLQLVGLRCGVTRTITPPASYSTTRVAIVGDSFLYGSGINAAGGASHLDFGAIAMRNLGIIEHRSFGISGSGIVNAGGGVGTYLQRIADVTSYAPDVVIVQGSINDTGQSGIQAATTTYLQALQAACPGAKIVMLGFVSTNNQTAPEALQNAAYLAAAAAAGVPYIDASVWITGTGNTGATTGDGPADFYQSSVTANHPSTAGHAYIGRRLAQSVASLLGLAI